MRPGAQSVTIKRLQVLLDCESLCQMTRENPGGDMAARAACRCSLPGFDSSRWDPAAQPDASADAERLAGDLAGNAWHAGFDLDYDLERDGCSVGWANSPFGASVMAYAGSRAYDTPLRSLNVRALSKAVHPDENTPRLLNLVAYGEKAEDNAYAYCREVLSR